MVDLMPVWRRFAGSLEAAWIVSSRDCLLGEEDSAYPPRGPLKDRPGHRLLKMTFLLDSMDCSLELAQNIPSLNAVVHP